MDEDESRIGIDFAEGIDREYVVGALEHPLAAASLMLQVLEEALVEPVGFEVAGLIEPSLVRRDILGGVESEAAEDMAGDFDAFLGAASIEGVEAWELGREEQES
jgi:hypothetical protein